MPVALVVPAIQRDDGQTDDSGAAAIPPLPCQAACVRTRKGKVGRPLRGAPPFIVCGHAFIALDAGIVKEAVRRSAVESGSPAPRLRVLCRRVMAP